jgi:hypothetical protein
MEDCALRYITQMSDFSSHLMIQAGIQMYEQAY